MKITVEKLEELGACSDGLDAFKSEFPNGAEFKDISERAINKGGDSLSYALWLAPRLMTKDNAVRFAIYAAREASHIFEAAYPEEKRPRKAIEAAEAWLENPSEETANAAARAASSARAAAYAAYAEAYAAYAEAYAAYAAAYAEAYAAYAAAYAEAYAAAYAAYAAASSARAAAYAAYAAAYADAYAAADAAYADGLKIKFLRYAVELLEKEQNER